MAEKNYSVVYCGKISVEVKVKAESLEAAQKQADEDMEIVFDDCRSAIVGAFWSNDLNSDGPDLDEMEVESVMHDAFADMQEGAND